MHPGGRLRKLVDKFRFSPAPRLRDYPELFVSAQELSLAPLCSRRVEEPHARVKRFTTAAPCALPAVVSADLRGEEHVQRLEAEPDFYKYVMRQWHSPLLFNRLLGLVGKVAPNMKFSDRVRKVYLYGMYRNTANPKLDNAMQLYKQTVERQKKCQEEGLPMVAKLEIDFFKTRMQAGEIFSIDFDLVGGAIAEIGEGARVGAERESFSTEAWLQQLDSRPVVEQDIVRAVTEAVGSGRHMFLRVVNPRPDTRAENTPSHMERLRHRVACELLHFMAVSDGAELHSTGTVVALDLKALIMGNKLQDIFGCILRWNDVGVWALSQVPPKVFQDSDMLALPAEASNTDSSGVAEAALARFD